MRGRARTLVLMFHRLRAHSTECGFDVSMSLFRGYLDAITEGQLTNYGKQVMLTFDDGHVSDIELALPELMLRKLTAVFFVVPSLVGTTGYLAWDDVLTLERCGMTIGSHTWSHRNLALTDRETLLFELGQSKTGIENMLGVPVDFLALPGGFAPKAISCYAKSVGYSHVFTSRPGLWNGRSCLVPRVCVRSTLAPEQMRDLVKGRPNEYYVRERVKYGVRAFLGPKLFSAAYDKWHRTRG